jgi:branched-subunit amino acid aminotransferase/4-amino-4-deoxychorismate lyase
MTQHSEPVAYFNGQCRPAHKVAIPWWDLGFSQGVSIVEQLRTYGGRVPLLKNHLKRLSRGLRQLGLVDSVSLAVIEEAITEIAGRNYPLLPVGWDLGICAVVTPGASRTLIPQDQHNDDFGPTTLVHSFPLPFADWSREFQTGVQLATSTVRAIPASCIPTDFKHRSRLSYYLAHADIDARVPGRRPLLLTTDGSLADGTTGGILFFREGCWHAPLSDQALSSVSVSVVEELLRGGGTQIVRRRIGRDELESFDEVIWCSTPTGILPVTEIDDRANFPGYAGKSFGRIAELWAEHVGLDYLTQARRVIASLTASTAATRL